jgi:hypothetical protein
MTQHIDQPRHRRIENDEYRDVAGNGRPMPNGYGMPPAGYGFPQHQIPQQFAPSFQSFGGAQHASGPQPVLPAYPQTYPPSYAPQYAMPQQPVPSQRSHAAPSPQPQQPQSNGLATAGLVVAIIGAVFSFIPFVGTVAWFIAPIGLVLSAVGLVKSKRARSGRGKSIAGIVLSVVALIMCVLYTSVFVASVGNAAQQTAAVHQVTYKVTTAKGSKITATYSQSQNDNLASASVSDAASPWSENAQVSGVMGPTVTASLSPNLENPNKKDTISCTIIEDGVQVATNSASGVDAMVTCTK